MKPYFPTLQGNERLKQQLGDRVLQGTMAHAYLLQGEIGTGKRLFAHLLAAAMCCEQRTADGVPLPCGVCNTCRKIMEDRTPDLTVIERGDNATIGIEAIRRAKEDMYLSSTENDKKVYIICEANKMTIAAQNALLIALEEPPRDVMIFLLCDDASSLLPTVRSRVQTIRMSLFDPQQMAAFLSTDPKAQRLRTESEELFLDLIVSAAGSPGRALGLLARKEMGALSAKRDCVLAILSAVHSRMRFSTLYEAIGGLSTKRQDMIEELGQLLLALRDLILLKRDENAPLCFFGDRDAARERCDTISLRALFAIYDATQAAILQLNQNVNIGVVTASFADALRAAPSK
ncbi:MAG: DNA polymerase III subunit [Clostridia bacterium]|nr:DNA polymerase III subunit [Clostridia bacterium]